MGSGTHRAQRKALGSRGGRRSGTKSVKTRGKGPNRMQQFRGELKAAMKRSRREARVGKKA